MKIVFLAIFIFSGCLSSAQNSIDLTVVSTSANLAYQTVTLNNSYLCPNQQFSENNDQYKGHDYSYYNQLYQKGNSRRKTGGKLMLIGGVNLAAGSFVGFVGVLLGGFAQDGSDAVFTTGGILVLGGFITFNVGIPFVISGEIIKGKNKKNMENGWQEKKLNARSFTLKASSNGIGLALNF